MTQLRDQAGHLEAGQLPALAGLRTLGDLDLDLAAIVEVLGGDAEATGSDLLDGRIRIVAIGARLGTRRVLAAFAGIAARADAVHRDGQRLMRFGAQGAERNPGRDQTFADLGDALDFLDRDGGTALVPKIEQVAQGDRGQLAHGFRIAPEGLVAVRLDRLLQHVDQAAIEGMRLARQATLVQATDRQRDRCLVPGALVQRQHAPRDAGQADAGDARLHAGEEFRNQRARQADRLEVHPPAIGADDRNADLRHRLQQALVDGLLVLGDAILERGVAKQPAPMPVRDAFLREVGVDRGRARAHQHGESVRIDAFRDADIETRKSTQGGAHQMRVHAAHR